MKTLEMWGPVCPAEDHNISDSYVAKHMYPEAIARTEEAMQRHQRIPRLLAAQAYAYAASGQRIEAQEILDELEGAAEQTYVDPVLLALVHVALGDHDHAFEMLDRAHEVGSPWLPIVRIDPKFDPLQDDPRLGDILRRIGLEPRRFAQQEEAA